MEKMFKVLINCNMIFIAIFSVILGFWFSDLRGYFLSIAGIAIMVEIIARVVKSKVVETLKNTKERVMHFIMVGNVLQIIGGLAFIVSLGFILFEEMDLSALCMLVGAFFYALHVKIQNYE